MFKYQLDTGRIHGFIKKNPTLIQKRKALAKEGQRLAEAEEVSQFVGSGMQSAGERFLDRINQEIYDAKPQWEKDAIQKEIELLAKGEELTDELAPIAIVKPELNDEYLKSIGREDLCYWGRA